MNQFRLIQKANSTDGAKIRETKLVANDNSMLFFPKLII